MAVGFNWEDILRDQGRGIATQIAHKLDRDVLRVKFKGLNESGDVVAASVTADLTIFNPKERAETLVRIARLVDAEVNKLQVLSE